MRRSSKKMLVKLGSKTDAKPVSSTVSDTDLSLSGDQRLILSVLKEIKVNQTDEQCLFTVMNSIMISLPSVMQDRISPDARSIKAEGLNSFKLNQAETEQVLSGVESKLSKEDEICQLFLEEKFELLQRTGIHTFTRAVADDLKKYIGAPDAKDKDKHITPNGLVIQYLLKSMGFKRIVKSMVLSMLEPSKQLLGLDILLQPKDFISGMVNGDFMRMTFTKLSDEMDNYAKLSEPDLNFLASKLFKKHKYIYICEDLGTGNFAKVMRPLCLLIQSIPEHASNRRSKMELALDSFSGEFGLVEIQVIKKHRTRLLGGLLKWEDDAVDLVEKLKCRLERDLFPKINRGLQLMQAVSHTTSPMCYEASTSLETIAITAVEATVDLKAVANQAVNMVGSKSLGKGS